MDSGQELHFLSLDWQLFNSCMLVQTSVVWSKDLFVLSHAAQSGLHFPATFQAQAGGKWEVLRTFLACWSLALRAGHCGRLSITNITHCQDDFKNIMHLPL